MDNRKEIRDFVEKLTEKINDICDNGDCDSEYYDSIKIKDIEVSFYYTNNDNNLEMQILNSGICIDLDLSDDISYYDIYDSLMIIIAEKYIDE